MSEELLILRALLQRPIAFSPLLARIGGSATAGLFMSQALYWCDKGADSEGWFYKTGVEWQEETCMTRREQEIARERWQSLGALEMHKHGVPPVMHYRVDHERLLALVRASVQINLPDMTNQFATSDKLNCQNLQIDLPDMTNLYNTETTTDTTTETMAEKARMHAHVPSQEYDGDDTSLSGKRTYPLTLDDTMKEKDFVLFGMKRPTEKLGGSKAPDRAVATKAGLDWAVGIGWHAGLQELQQTVDACLDHHASAGNRKEDWTKAIRTWVRKAIEYGTDRRLLVAASDLEQPHGQRGQESRPDNKAGRTLTAVERLAAKQAARTVAEQTGSDAVEQRHLDRGSG